MGVQLTDEMIVGAKETQEKYGIPASIALGQIMLESGGSYPGGLSRLAYQANNLFGIKGSGSLGSVTMSTVEEGYRGRYYSAANFKKYASIQESIEDHGKLLSTDKYTKQTKSATNVEEYATALQKAGYATDSQYADKLINVINSNNLKQYDSDFVINGTASGTEDKKLDFAGQIVRFIIIIVLIVIAIVLFMKAFDIKIGGII